VHGADHVRVIEKDLAAMFPENESMNAATVNEALRILLETGDRKKKKA
jgi:hypothetical protein